MATDPSTALPDGSSQPQLDAFGQPIPLPPDAPQQAWAGWTSSQTATAAGNALSNANDAVIGVLNTAGNPWFYPALLVIGLLWAYPTVRDHFR